MPSQSELRQQITNQIIAALEQNQIPWRRPWRTSANAGRPANCLSRKNYSGINPLLLEIHALKFGFKSRWWGTFQQWEKSGCKVKRRPNGVDAGAWGCKIVFYKPVTKTTIDQATGDEDEREFYLMKTWSVFNAEQTEGPGVEKFLVAESESDAPVWPDYGPAEELISATGAVVHNEGESAHYARPVPEGAWPNHERGDEVFVPVKDRFESLAAFYETTFHELAHWSEVRLGWDWKKETYELGELVAEISAAYLAQELGVPNGDLDNHARYVAHWLSAMKGDPRFIFRASTQAAKVADFLLGFVKKNQPQTDEIEVA